MIRRLIDRESRSRRCYLEQYSSRLAEVDGGKIVPVKNRRGIEGLLHQLAAHCRLRIAVGRCESDVMHGAAATEPRRLSGEHSTSI